MKIIQKLITPAYFSSIPVNIAICLPRIIAGLLLAFEFGSSKFGLPWSGKPELGMFQVADWFPNDVAQFGFPFSIAPTLFAWMGAATEAIGGLFLAVGLGTRIVGGFIGITMLTAIFFQKWPNAMEYGSSWPLLPAMGFLWVAIYAVLFGSGKIGLDQVISNKWK